MPRFGWTNNIKPVLKGTFEIKKLSKKGKLGKQMTPIPKILFCITYQPILQLSAHKSFGPSIVLYILI